MHEWQKSLTSLGHGDPFAIMHETQESTYPLWSVTREWKGRFLFTFTLGSLGSLLWVGLQVGSPLKTLALAGSCVIASAALSVILIEGGGRVALSVAQQWSEFASRRQKQRDDSRKREREVILRLFLSRADVDTLLDLDTGALVEKLLSRRISVSGPPPTSVTVEVTEPWARWIARRDAALRAGESFDEAPPAGPAVEEDDDEQPSQVPDR